jgi:hypothetical protein
MDGESVLVAEDAAVKAVTCRAAEIVVVGRLCRPGRRHSRMRSDDGLQLLFKQQRAVLDGLSVPCLFAEDLKRWALQPKGFIVPGRNEARVAERAAASERAASFKVDLFDGELYTCEGTCRGEEAGVQLLLQRGRRVKLATRGGHSGPNVETLLI